MSLLQLLLNILWLLFGGIWMAAGWVIAGLIMALTIIGLPWTFAAFKIAAYSSLPFGNQAVSRRECTGRKISAPALWAFSAIFCGWSSPAGGWRWRMSSPP